MATDESVSWKPLARGAGARQGLVIVRSDVIAAAANLTGHLFLCDKPYRLIKVQLIAVTVATATKYLQIEKMLATEAAGAGDDLLADNTGSGVDVDGDLVAETVFTATLSATETLLHLATGDRLGWVQEASATSLAGLVVWAHLLPMPDEKAYITPAQA